MGKLVRSNGLFSNLEAIGPSPLPPEPWQTTQLIWNNSLPRWREVWSADIGFGGTPKSRLKATPSTGIASVGTGKGWYIGWKEGWISMKLTQLILITSYANISTTTRAINRNNPAMVSRLKAGFIASSPPPA